ncbi:sigma-70 family RNA polymerase sigma factor [Streptomyces fagopyri]|uniref:sigma-70 family RNA polymerase sigma factor n=1 Tax=Streptomyces fagopyri TaxID=2662397 RepID=UPI0038119424
MITKANAASPRSDTREPALVARAQQGDRDAFAELYALHQPTVYIFVLMRVGHDRALAEDLTADVFLRSFAKLNTFAWTGKSIRAWFCTIARNRLLDHHRARTKQQVTYVGEMHDIADLWSDPEAVTEDLVLAEIDNQELRAAVRELNPSQRALIVLRFFKEYSVDETARAMSLSTGAVKTMQYRATRALGRTLLAVAA